MSTELRHHIDFDARLAAKAATDPAPAIEFTLGGHDFSCVVPPPIGGLLQVVRAEESGDKTALMAAIDRVLRSFIVPEQRAEWDEVVAGVQDISILNDVAEFVIAAAQGGLTPAPRAVRRAAARPAKNGTKPRAKR